MKDILLFLLLSFLFVIYLFHQQEKKSSICYSDNDEKMYFLSYKGVITKKYIRPLSHGTKYVDLETKDTTMSIYVANNEEYNTPFDKRFWDYVLEGDSIIKYRKSNTAIIKRTRIFWFNLRKVQFFGNRVHLQKQQSVFYLKSYSQSTPLLN
jgi:hypothetical protein